MLRSLLRLVLIPILGFSFFQAFSQDLKTKNLVIVTLDGFRWEEVFRGSDSALVESKFTEGKNEIRLKFGASTVSERRKKLLPFFWSELVSKGQIYGNRDLGNMDEISNPYYFSYPGYNEIFTGFPDPRINTNGALLNPNKNVLEFFNEQKGMEGKVAVFSSWERFPQIFNISRSKILVNSGYKDLELPKNSARIQLLNKIQHEGPKLLGDSTRLDFLTYEMGMNYMDEFKPRILYFSFDETDDFAHEGHYDWYLKAAHTEDDFIRMLWEKIQSNPFYKDKTTLILTCDHGRGKGDGTGDRWTDHGKGTPASNQTWFAILGPDTPNSGEMKISSTTYHKQLAQTMAKFLGLDFKASAGHEVGEAISSVLKN